MPYFDPPVTPAPPRTGYASDEQTTNRRWNFDSRKAPDSAPEAPQVTR